MKSTQLSVSVLNMTEQQQEDLAKGIEAVAKFLEIELEPVSPGDKVLVETFEI